jgi:tRNA G37 N-methylase TrmD
MFYKNCSGQCQESILQKGTESAIKVWRYQGGNSEAVNRRADIQHSGQKKKEQITNNDLQNITQKIMQNL